MFFTRSGKKSVNTKSSDSRFGKSTEQQGWNEPHMQDQNITADSLKNATFVQYGRRIREVVVVKEMHNGMVSSDDCSSE